MTSASRMADPAAAADDGPRECPCHAIFTYGTLRADYCERGDRWGVKERFACDHRPAWVDGFALYQDKDKAYPFVIEDAGMHVAGTLLLFDPDVFEEALAACDRIEGYSATQPPGDCLYQRKLVTATTGSLSGKGAEVSCYIYHQTAVTDAAQPIASNDWKTWTTESGQWGEWVEAEEKTEGGEDQTTLVFCYGSNGLEQLRERCENPSLTAQAALLPGWVRCFAGQSKRWTGAVASIVRIEQMANPCRCTCVAGSVVALSAADISRLDPFEGVDSRKPDSRDGVYRHEPLLVRVRVDKDEEQGYSYHWRDAIAYVKNNLEWRGPPSVSYLRACKRNIEQFWCKDMEGVKITVRKGDGEVVFEWTEAQTGEGEERLQARSRNPALTAQQRRLATRLTELQDARDWRGVVALEKETLDLARELRGARPGLAGKIHGALGHAFHETGDYGRARELHEQARAMAEALGDRAGVAKACGNLGLCYHRTGDYGRARELQEQARAMAEALGDRAGVAKACGSLGDCYLSTGDHERARELHEQRRAICEALGDRAGMAKACGSLGICYNRTGDYGRARELHEQAKAICEALGDRAGVAAACAGTPAGAADTVTDTTISPERLDTIDSIAREGYSSFAVESRRGLPWTCPCCTLVNEKLVSECEVCGEPNYARRAPAAAQASSNSLQEEAANSFANLPVPDGQGANGEATETLGCATMISSRDVCSARSNVLGTLQHPLPGIDEECECDAEAPASPLPLPALSGSSRGNAATDAVMVHLREYLSSNNLLTDKELETLQPSTLKVCAVCSQASGELVRLKECSLQTSLCLHCVDSFSDNYNMHEHHEELFKCLCCDTKIYDFEIIT